MFRAMQKPNRIGKGPVVRRGASLISDQAWSEIARTLGLTKRELQIVQSVFDNLPEAGVAKRLRISEHTAHTHLNRLFKKLTVNTRTDLVVRIMEQMIALTLAEAGVLPPICRRHRNGDCGWHQPEPAQQVVTDTPGRAGHACLHVGQTADYSKPANQSII
jgi:DNA-binding CsgD family transcriptional regulator